jgi:putative colanic acid biosynthesis acetyltransferase WcaF
MDLSQYSAAHFDRGASRIQEAGWVLIKCLFFQNPIPWPSGLRTAWLRLFGAKVGKQVVIRANTNITFPWRLTIGDHVWIGEEVMILSLAPVRIESSVCISQRAFLCTGSHDHRTGNFELVTKPITVRTGSWIAAQAFIAPGVEIGRNSVVSAGSVVLRDVPAESVVRGNPATMNDPRA